MGPSVHFERTYRWAWDEGYPPSAAERVASADVEFDARFPARRRLVNVTRHFAPAAWWWSARYFRKAVQAGSLELLGWSLHCAQDAVAHGVLGQRHALWRVRLGRNPDSWEAAPETVRVRIETVTRTRLRRFAGLSGGRYPESPTPTEEP